MIWPHSSTEKHDRSSSSFSPGGQQNSGASGGVDLDAASALAVDFIKFANCVEAWRKRKRGKQNQRPNLDRESPRIVVCNTHSVKHFFNTRNCKVSKKMFHAVRWQTRKQAYRDCRHDRCHVVGEADL